MQLVSYGAQDIYLTGNAQITFFKALYRRYTNFSMETVENVFTGEVEFGRKLTCKITKSGDLISKMYLRITLNEVDPGGSKFAWTKKLGHAIVKMSEIEIGGSIIDTQYGVWLDIWYELSREGDHEKGYSEMIGNVEEMTGYNENVKEETVIYIPLKFWFNKHIGLSIPLIALQYHEVNVRILFENLNRLIVSDCNFDITQVTMKDATLLVNYIYLDTKERRRFAIVGHEYLIEQVQFNGLETLTSDDKKYQLDYNHPTKEIIWANVNGNYITGEEFIYYTHEDIWKPEEAAKWILENSISIGIDPTNIVGGNWITVSSNTFTTIGNINVRNANVNDVYVNGESLKVGNYGITEKIKADVIINSDSTLTLEEVETTITVRDLSIPKRLMTDTRFNTCDPRVNIFGNYGLLIDGSINPVRDGLIELNGHERFKRREGYYFNYVQPETYHRNTPADGINVYSFSLYPSEHQPSGTSNLSRIESTTLILTFDDLTLSDGLVNINFYNEFNEFYIFGLSYNILRIMSGLAGLAYTLA